MLGILSLTNLLYSFICLPYPVHFPGALMFPIYSYKYKLLYSYIHLFLMKSSIILFLNTSINYFYRLDSASRNLFNSSSPIGSLYNSLTSQRPLSLIFTFGEKCPNHPSDVEHSLHRDTVEISLDSRASL